MKICRVGTTGTTAFTMESIVGGTIKKGAQVMITAIDEVYGYTLKDLKSGFRVDRAGYYSIIPDTIKK